MESICHEKNSRTWTEMLREKCEVEVNPEDRVLTKEEIIEGVKGKDALLCLLTDDIDEEIMDANPNLKVISNYAVGFNNIKVEEATSAACLSPTPQAFSLKPQQTWLGSAHGSRQKDSGVRQIHQGRKIQRLGPNAAIGL